MLSLAWQFLFPEKHFAKSEASDGDNDFVQVRTRDVENFQVENGQVVGTTAVIDIDESQISATQGPKPEKYPSYPPSLGHFC
jgi:hypothetical protein